MLLGILVDLSRQGLVNDAKLDLALKDEGRHCGSRQNLDQEPAHRARA